MEAIDLKNGRALIVVAHPDDETIWAGGVLLRYKNISWTIFSLCRKDDKDRMPKFLLATKFYKVCGIISDLDDEGNLSAQKSISGIKKRIRNELAEKKFDYIFTHAPEGEYNHPRHKETSLAVKEMLRKNELAASQVFCFAYKLDKKKEICVPSALADFYLKLSAKEFKTKRDIMRNLYGFDKMSFENRSCAKIETFTKLIL